MVPSQELLNSANSKGTPRFLLSSVKTDVKFLSLASCKDGPFLPLVSLAAAVDK